MPMVTGSETIPKLLLTDAAIGKLKPPESGLTDWFDTKRPGLSLRISHTGLKIWTYHYRFEGKQRRATLGHYPKARGLPGMTLADARAAAASIRDKAKGGDDPAPPKPEPTAAAGDVDDSFEKVAEKWLKLDQAKNKSVKEVNRVIGVYALPHWRDKPMRDITRRDAAALIDGIALRGAETMARRVHAHLHRLFEWAVGRGIVEANPFAKLPKPGQEIARDRVLDDDELIAVLKAARETPFPFGSAIQLLVYTAARRQEIGELKWSELIDYGIHFEGVRTKGGKPHDIPLSAPARAIIDGLPRMVGCDFVFSTTGKSAVSGWSRAKRLLDLKIGDMRGAPIPPWRFHDLRRSVATGLEKLKVPIAVTEAVLAHTSGSKSGVTGVYQRHDYRDEKRAALAAWGRFVEMLIDERATWVAIEAHINASDERERERKEFNEAINEGGARWQSYRAKFTDKPNANVTSLRTVEA